MKIYITVILILSLISMVLTRVGDINKTNNKYKILGNLFGIVGEIIGIIIACIFLWKL